MEWLTTVIRKSVVSLLPPFPDLARKSGASGSGLENHPRETWIGSPMR